MPPLLAIEHLTTVFDLPSGPAAAVDDVPAVQFAEVSSRSSTAPPLAGISTVSGRPSARGASAGVLVIE